MSYNMVARGHCKHNSKNFLRVAQNMAKQVSACIRDNGVHFQHILWIVFRILLYCSVTKWNFGCILKLILFIVWLECPEIMLHFLYKVYSIIHFFLNINLYS
jgi:hypothetical protein